MRMLLALVLCMAGVANAEMRKEADTILLSAPRSSWELKVPARGLELKSEERNEDGSGVYYLYQNAGTGLIFSLYLEPAGDCRAAQDCREMAWKRPNPAIQDPREVERFDENGFAVIKYVVPSYQGATVNQLNYSAHAVRDGIWVDIHLSKSDARSEDAVLLRSFLKGISFTKRAQGTAATKSSDRRFPLPDHGTVTMTVPPIWTDQVRQPPDRLPPTIVFTPELGNAFRIMITPIWAANKDIPVPSDRDIRSSVEQSLEGIRGQAVESSIPVRELKREGVRGYYFSVTDRAPKPGEFKFMTQGAVASGSLIITFTVLSNDGTGKVEKDAITMISSIKHVQ